MQLIHGSDRVPEEARGAVLAIGNFDGVHRGHQALLGRAIEEARAIATRSAVMVFEPHPREFFHPEEPQFRLTPLPLKLKLLERLGLDVAVVQAFDARFAARSAEEFIAEDLVARLKVRHVVVGYDFFFGVGRGGTAETMRQTGDRLGFGVTVIAPVGEEGEVFSSSAIRVKLAQGDVKGAADALGYWWRVSGRVVGGTKRGAGLGFPTANVPLPRGTALAHGVYAVHAQLAGNRHDGAAYLGTRPTFGEGMPVLEVFLFDFDGDLYGREIEVEFIDFVRGDRKFDSADALKAQMTQDCARAREALAAAGPREIGASRL